MQNFVEGVWLWLEIEHHQTFHAVAIIATWKKTLENFETIWDQSITGKNIWMFRCPDIFERYSSNGEEDKNMFQDFRSKRVYA